MAFKSVGILAIFILYATCITDAYYMVGVKGVDDFECENTVKPDEKDLELLRTTKQAPDTPKMVELTNCEAKHLKIILEDGSVNEKTDEWGLHRGQCYPTVTDTCKGLGLKASQEQRARVILNCMVADHPEAVDKTNPNCVKKQTVAINSTGVNAGEETYKI